MIGTFKAMILVSGAAPDAPPPGIPVLAIQGRHDTMMSPTAVRTYTARAGGRYVELDAGHFGMLIRAKETQDALIHWLTG
jgi:pimeloyl-ACP methyl ester carboxylesterase